MPDFDAIRQELAALLKRHLDFKRLRLRGLKGANEEFLLAATTQNLKRFAKNGSVPKPQAGSPNIDQNAAFGRDYSGLDRLSSAKHKMS